MPGWRFLPGPSGSEHRTVDLKEMFFFGKFICRFMSEACFLKHSARRLIQMIPDCSVSLKFCLFVWIGQPGARAHKATCSSLGSP